jgi:hypothetical protein
MVMIRETITVMGTEAAEAMAVVATHRETIHMEVDASMRPARCMPRLATLPRIVGRDSTKATGSG